MKYLTILKLRGWILLFLVSFTCSFSGGSASAALLDLGPVVPQVIGSSDPNLGHGFPLWYRDNNRIPLQLCLDRSGMCLTAEPNPAAPFSFPNNLGDEAFWWVGDALIDYPQQGILARAGSAILVQGIEAAFATGDVVPGQQVSFARIRIRIDTPYVGEYLVTTPYKQFRFTVDAATIGDGRRAINYTEDIGLGQPGEFSGALQGSVGPFLYCSTGPVTVLGFGTYLGDPNVPCSVLGSVFNPPSLPGPANYFRVQGPNGFDVQTNQFSVSGKLYSAPIATPLAVDRASYALDQSGLQVNAFATTQPLSNQTNAGAPFPLNFALAGVASALQLSAEGIPNQAMTSNDPGDGKFFSASGVLANPGAVPATVTVSNTADQPVTVKSVALVDEVIIEKAQYNPLTATLSVAASSQDKVNAPALQLFMPGLEAPLGTLSNGRIEVSFPFSDNSGAQHRTVAIPSSTISVSSAKGGSASAPVTTFSTVLPAPVTGVTVAQSVASPQPVGTPISFLASASGGSGNYEYRFYLNSGSGFQVVQPYGAANSWTWTPNNTGKYDIFVEARNAGSSVVRDSYTSVNFYQITAPATTISVSADKAAPQAAGTPVAFTASASGGSGPYEYRFWLNVGGTYLMVQDYNSAKTWTWNPTVPGLYDVFVEARTQGYQNREAFTSLLAYGITPAPAGAVTVQASLPSPQAPLTKVVFTANASGGSGSYEYRFYLNSGAGYVLVQPYSTLNSWSFTPTAAGNYDVFVESRSVGSSASREAFNSLTFYQIQ